MRAFLFGLFLFSQNILNAAEIKFVKNMGWKQVLQLAQQQKKMIFFDAYASWCGPCKYMERSVYTDDAVAKYYNANFINVKLDMEVGEGIKLAEQFGIRAYPTLLFIDPSGKILHKAVGALDEKEFLVLGKEAKDPDMQYYILKAKAKNSTLSDADFAKWAGMAKRAYDEDLQPYIKTFFSKRKDILLNEHTASVAIKYADELTDEQLLYIVNSQAKLQSFFKKDEREAWRMVYDKLFKLATTAYNESRDQDDARKIFQKYLPSAVSLAMTDLAFHVALFIDEDSKAATELLMEHLKKRSVTLRDAAEIFIENISDLTVPDATYMISELEQYRVSAAEGHAGYLYLMQAICYALTGNAEKGKPFAQKVIAENTMPAAYTLMVRELYGM